MNDVRIVTFAPNAERYKPQKSLIEDRDPSEFLPVTEAIKVHAKLVGGRRKVGRSAMFRWMKSGRNGVVLQSCMFDGLRCTTEEWLRDFIYTDCPATPPELDAAVNRAEQRTAARPGAARRDVRRHEQAMERARKMGIA